MKFLLSTFLSIWLYKGPMLMGLKALFGWSSSLMDRKGLTVITPGLSEAFA